MIKTNLKLVAPAKENRTVTPLRRPNADIRPREHMTEREVDKIVEAAKGNRWGQRDSTMILIAFRHGLRASEVCGLQWSDVEFETGTLHLRRAKGGATATHPLLGDELRALRALKREAKSPFIFVSERGAPFSTSGLAKLIERVGIEAKMPFKVIRTCLGMPPASCWRTRAPIRGRFRHTSATAAIQSTVRYTEFAPGRFKNLWRAQSARRRPSLTVSAILPSEIETCGAT